MRFSQFISEMESMDDNSMDSINQTLADGLENNFQSPEDGFEIIKTILGGHGIVVDPTEELNPEGDEIALDVDTQDGPLVLYVIYSLTDDGTYEFYAELTDDEGLEEIISDEEEEDEVEKD